LAKPDCKCKDCGCGQKLIQEVLEQIEDQRLPYTEEWLDSNTRIRHFDHTMPDHLFKWHYDLEDRVIEPLEETDWQFQFDDQLPIPIEGQIFIPKGVYHRLIKGTTPLSLAITV